MYANHDNLVDAGASGTKASTKHLESWITYRGHSRSRILGSLKSWQWTAYYCIIIFHRFRDIFFCSWLTPLLFHPNFGVFPLHQIAHVRVNVSRCLKLFGREIIFEVFQPIWSRYLNVTDGQNVSAVQGHPRSLILVPIESVYATSY